MNDDDQPRWLFYVELLGRALLAPAVAVAALLWLAWIIRGVR